MFGEGTPTELQIILVLAVIKYIKHAKGYNLLKNMPNRERQDAQN